MNDGTRVKPDRGLAAALRAVGQQFGEFKHTLRDLTFAELLRRKGMRNVQVLVVPGVPPYVYGDWLARPGAPTLLIYGHHDGGRGTLLHVAAVAAYLGATGSLPCNVKFLIGGAEAIGSENLARFLQRHQKRMAADAVVLSDTANVDTGIPGLTFPLGGRCQVEVEVRCLERPVHSGQKGGALPDPVRILCALIADLRAKDGSLNVPGLHRRVARRTIWTRPSLTVIAFEAQPILGSSNQILDVVRARISMRTVPEMDSRKAGELLVRKLTRRLPSGARAQARVVSSTPWWRTEPLLTGALNPASGVQSENQSQHLGDWKKCMRAAVHLYDEVSRRPV